MQRNSISKEKKGRGKRQSSEEILALFRDFILSFRKKKKGRGEQNVQSEVFKTLQRYPSPVKERKGKKKGKISQCLLERKKEKGR